jgi:hypothetical protein
MSKFFTRERFGRPQVLAGLLLLALLAQCVWLLGHTRANPASQEEESAQIAMGLQLWGKQNAPASHEAEAMHSPPLDVPHPGVFFDKDHSALWYLIISAPLLPCGTATLENWTKTYWLAVIPNLIFALLLGASLWYVARRLYGNAGGYIALAFFCFSPVIVLSSTSWFTPPEMGAAWGAFGSIFTAIAVSHTLYAPREVVLWNWRRIVLLGLSFTLAVGSQFSLVILVPVALLFMFYLAPARKAAAFAIWISACALASVLLFAAYRFRPSLFLRALGHADFFGVIWQAFTVADAYFAVIKRLANLGPAVLALLPIVLIVYIFWRRTRYFGNTAPWLVFLLLLVLHLGSPHFPGFGFGLMAVPFLFVFMAGVISDLLETDNRALVLSCVGIVLLVGTLWNFWQLSRIT